MFPRSQYFAVLKKLYTFLIYIERLSLGISWIILSIFSAMMHPEYKAGKRA